MNFFEHQDKAKRQSKRLYFVFALAVIGIVLLVDLLVAAGIVYAGASQSNLSQTNLFSVQWLEQNIGIMAASTFITSGFIGAASLYKTVRLGFGGGTVAKDMGGTLITADNSDPLRKRLYNIVEEMAIASGTPMPEVYVLEQEAAINAFAAGSQASNAAIAVTRGALEQFERDELQGVIAHEFSHILNGDMRINIRIMGVLFGILIISLIGRTLLRSTRLTRYSSRNNKGVSVILVIGAALAVIGWIGLSLGRLIKAAVSRQREFLADASAVQFTRQTDGIKIALMKIASNRHSSVLKANDPEEITHMLFASGLRGASGPFATHPPVIDRLSAIDSNFKASEIKDMAIKLEKNAKRVAEQAEKELAEAEKKAEEKEKTGMSKALGGLGVLLPGALSDAIGNPAIEHVIYAESLRQELPQKLLNAAHDQDKDVFHLTLALLLHPDEPQQIKQLALLEKQLGPDRLAKIKDYYQELQKKSEQFRLPLLDLAFPALKRRSIEELHFLRDLIDKIIHTDNKVEPFEYALSRVLASHLADVWAPYAQGKASKKPAQLQSAIQHLFAVVSLEGSHDNATNEQAYEDGIAYFVKHPKSSKLLKYFKQDELSQYHEPGNDWIQTLDHGLLSLDALPMSVKQVLIEALAITIGFDDEVSLVESELLRAICSTLHCPLPPMLKT